MMELCSRCKKRVAVVFVTRFEGGKTLNEGICLKCAKELGIKPVESMIEKMGLSDEDLDRMDMEMDSMINGENPENENLTESDDNEEETDSEEKTDSSEEDSDGTDDTDKGNAPAIDFRKFFAPLTNLGVQKNSDSEKTDGTKEKSGTSGEKKKQKRKYLNMYCSNLTGLAKEGKLDRVIGREREIARTVQILCRRQKTTPA